MNEQHDTWNEEIDRVLRGIQAAEPPRGLEQRILLAMEREPVHAKAAPLSAQAIRWSLAAASIAALLFAVSWHRNRSYSNVPPLTSGHATVRNVNALEAAQKSAPTRRIVRSRKAHTVIVQPAPSPTLGPIIEPPVTREERLLQQAALRRNPEVVAALHAQDLPPLQRRTVTEIDGDSIIIISDIP